MIPVPFEQAKNLISLKEVNHGFYGRLGLNENEDFNCSILFGQEQVEINRKIAKNAIGGDDATLASVRQTHSSDVVVFDGTMPKDYQPKADALITKQSGIALSILTADCTPILFADAKAGVIGAAHAGWQGAVGGIIANTIDAMIEIGASKNNIIAAIGPTISGASYEVGAERAADIINANIRAKEFIYILSNASREHFDLPKFVLAELRLAGIENVEQVGGCTCANSDEYFSHRAYTNHNVTQGRQISIISLK